MKYGHVQVKQVRCGRKNCRCARGFYHTSYYHAWDEGGVRHRKYLRRAEVPAMRELCEAHRAWKIKIRAARDEHNALHAHIRELKRIFARWK